MSNLNGISNASQEYTILLFFFNFNRYIEIKTNEKTKIDRVNSYDNYENEVNKLTTESCLDTKVHLLIFHVSISISWKFFFF